jgi:hypothetical protein
VVTRALFASFPVWTLFGVDFVGPVVGGLVGITPWSTDCIA